VSGGGCLRAVGGPGAGGAAVQARLQSARCTAHKRRRPRRQGSAPAMYARRSMSTGYRKCAIVHCHIRLLRVFHSAGVNVSVPLPCLSRHVAHIRRHEERVQAAGDDPKQAVQHIKLMRTLGATLNFPHHYPHGDNMISEYARACPGALWTQTRRQSSCQSEGAL
jgi:hypothetical protein